MGWDVLVLCGPYIWHAHRGILVVESLCFAQCLPTPPPVGEAGWGGGCSLDIDADPRCRCSTTKRSGSTNTILASWSAPSSLCT